MSIQAVLNNEKQWHVEVSDVRVGLRKMPKNSVHCCITSPPYFGLRSYLPAGHPSKGDEIGSEETPEQFVAGMVDVFGEVKRVLHPSGVLFLNLGDSYSSHGAGAAGKELDWMGDDIVNRKAAKPPVGFKVKDLLCVPFRVAMALQADGWFLRSIIPWLKRNSMPESVTDRPSASVEYIFLLAKSEDYFYDSEAVKIASNGHNSGNGFKRKERLSYQDANGARGSDEQWKSTGQRNRRNSDWFFESWQGLYEEVPGDPLAMIVNVNGFRGAHFATFPTKLVQPLVAAGTSERGACGACGEPWRRIVERDRQATRPGTNSKVKVKTPGKNSRFFQERDAQHSGEYKSERYAKEVGNRDTGRHVTATKTIGWEAGCNCPPSAGQVPCVVLDTFNGAGTVGLVARTMGRRYIGFELFEEYAEMSRRRIAAGITDAIPKQPKSQRGQKDLFAEAGEAKGNP